MSLESSGRVSLLLSVLIVLNIIHLSSSLPVECSPHNCKLPDCFCPGKDAPGGLEREKIPQMVLFTFDDAINEQVMPFYKELFNPTRLNPNGCPISATFFLSHNWTDYGMVKTLYQAGHEIASHSVTHRMPQEWWTYATYDSLTNEVCGQRDFIEKFARIPKENVKGLRVPFLELAGDNQFWMMEDQKFQYDSTMMTGPHDDGGVWPFTLDFPPAFPYVCSNYNCPKRRHPGIWEIPLNRWHDNHGLPCAMTDTCQSTFHTKKEVLSYLWRNFYRHYNGNRSPLGVNLRAVWFQAPHHFEAMIDFVDTLSLLNDVYLVSGEQAIAWMKNPKDVDAINTYEPWRTSCNERVLLPDLMNMLNEVTSRSNMRMISKENDILHDKNIKIDMEESSENTKEIGKNPESVVPIKDNEHYEESPYDNENDENKEIDMEESSENTKEVGKNSESVVPIKDKEYYEESSYDEELLYEKEFEGEAKTKMNEDVKELMKEIEQLIEDIPLTKEIPTHDDKINTNLEENTEKLYDPITNLDTPKASEDDSDIVKAKDEQESNSAIHTDTIENKDLDDDKTVETVHGANLEGHVEMNQQVFTKSQATSETVEDIDITDTPLPVIESDIEDIGKENNGENKDTGDDNGNSEEIQSSFDETEEKNKENMQILSVTKSKVIHDSVLPIVQPNENEKTIVKVRVGKTSPHVETPEVENQPKSVVDNTDTPLPVIESDIEDVSKEENNDDKESDTGHDNGNSEEIQSSSDETEEKSKEKKQILSVIESKAIHENVLPIVQLNENEKTIVKLRVGKTSPREEIPEAENQPKSLRIVINVDSEEEYDRGVFEKEETS